MGSFYTTCSISDLTITDGDDMYMQLILPSWVKNPYSIDGEKIGCGEKGLRVSNEGALGEFVPFGFPIEGQYADYGNISDVNKDRNVKMLEEYFNIPIDSILDCATDDRWYKHSYKPMIEDKEEEEYSGQFKSWTVGDNKMKNIHILKQLTVTYFRKEHYDFLSSEILGGDDYFNKERNGRLNNMIELLPKLEKDRPSSDDKEYVTLADVTDAQRKQFNEIFAKKQTDQDIIDILNSDSDRWWTPFEYKFYIPSISTTNMFQELPIGVLDAENIKKQSIFISNMYNLTKVLRPSYYGSQQDNFDAYIKFHEFTTNLVGDIKLNKKKDTILDEVSWALKNNLEKIDNKEIVEKIKKDIIEDLEIYGYNIKI